MKIGVQMYTLREETKTREGFVKALDRTAAMGYDGVQLSAVGCMNGEAPEVTAAEARELLDARGLACAATHRPWDSLAERPEEEAAFHKALGCSYTALGSAPDWAWSVSGARTFLEKFQPIHDRLAALGITVGYHNHAFEFRREEGGRMFDVLVQEGPWLPIEMDTYWVHMAGMEVVPVIKSLKGRLPVVHVKDVSPFGWKISYAPIGEGNLSWDAILPAFAEAGTEWLLVELDECPRDPYECLESSARFLKGALS